MFEIIINNYPVTDQIPACEKRTNRTSILELFKNVHFRCFYLLQKCYNRVFARCVQLFLLLLYSRVHDFIDTYWYRPVMECLVWDQS